MAELTYVFAGNIYEFQEYMRMHNLIGRDDIRYLESAHVLKYAPEVKTVIATGNYQGRADYAECALTCRHRLINFNG